MRKNGFTLVELIGVIVIIAMITLLTFPNLIDTIKRSEEKNYSEFLTSLELASEQYIESNSDLFLLTTPGDYAVITIEDLINEGLINTKMENPKTEKQINYEDTITVTLEVDYTKTYLFKSIDE